MSVVDFEAWAVPDLILTFRGRRYVVPPPDVDRAKQILAAAIRAEVNLKIEPGPVPEEIEQVLAEIGTSHPALTDEVYEQMVADKVPMQSIDRMSYYAVFYWARSAEYAAAVAMHLWALDENTADEPARDGEATGPKG